MGEKLEKFEPDIFCENCGQSYNDFIEYGFESWEKGFDIANSFPQGLWFCSESCYEGE